MLICLTNTPFPNICLEQLDYQICKAEKCFLIFTSGQKKDFYYICQPGKPCFRNLRTQ